MTHVHVVVPYPATNATVRARALHWIDRLVRSGRIEQSRVAIHGPGFGSRSVPVGEPLLLLRNRSRFTRGRQEQRLLRGAAPGVYDLDDGLPWDDGTLPELGRWWKRPFPRSLLARRAASAADRLIVGNDVLADWAQEWCRDVQMIPTCVEPSDYGRRTDWGLASDRPVVGWIGSPATEHYLDPIVDALLEVHRLTACRVEVVSGPGRLPQRLEGFAERILWSPAADRRISEWDVGIMPLADGVYERAKCGYKLLQYAASGVPAVGSPVGVNRALLHAMDALAPATWGAWRDALLEVLTEPAGRRARRARSGFEVAERYSYAAWEQRWVEAVEW